VLTRVDKSPLYCWLYFSVIAAPELVFYTTQIKSLIYSNYSYSSYILFYKNDINAWVAMVLW